MSTNITNSGLTGAGYTREISFDQSKLLQVVAQDEHRLNIDQKKSSMDKNEEKSFFLDAPGGTKKTFLIKLLLAKIRSTGKRALAIASFGNAVTLLEGDRTAHAMFR